MPSTTIANHRIFFEHGGAGAPVVIVHGSWTSHAAWGPVAAQLRAGHAVTAYDRLGHSASERPPGPYPRRRHEDDLIAIIERVAGGPAYVAGSSYGAVVALAVAARRPDLVRGVVAHEPPVTSLSGAREVRAAHAAMEAVAERIRGGDAEGGTRQFFEEVALGAGAWEILPEAFRAAAMGNAPAFLADMDDPAWPTLDLAAVNAYDGPILLTEGERSLPWFRPLIDALGAAVPQAGRATVIGAGHSPHATHPEAFAELIAAFCGRELPQRAAAA